VSYSHFRPLVFRIFKVAGFLLGLLIGKSIIQYPLFYYVTDLLYRCRLLISSQGNRNCYTGRTNLYSSTYLFKHTFVRFQWMSSPSVEISLNALRVYLSVQNFMHIPRDEISHHPVMVTLVVVISCLHVRTAVRSDAEKGLQSLFDSVFPGASH